MRSNVSRTDLNNAVIPELVCFIQKFDFSTRAYTENVMKFVFCGSKKNPKKPGVLIRHGYRRQPAENGLH